VWHYTSAEGIRSIVEHNVLWATSHRFMNDSQEPKYATFALNQAAVRARAELSQDQSVRFDAYMGFAERNGLEAFLLCAAREPDLLTVWRGYGSSVPYAIELDASVDLLPIEQTPRESHPSPPADWGPEIYGTDDEGRLIHGPDPDEVRIEVQHWTPVQYDATTARERVEQIALLARAKADPLSDALIPWMALGGIDLLQLKHPAFQDEREARMVLEVTPRWKFVKHRSTRFGLTPYIEVSTADETNQTDKNQRYITQPGKKLPIRSVHIGPSPLGEESVDALREFLEFQGYPDLPVVKSTTPFR
jgi:hypothetical protein